MKFGQATTSKARHSPGAKAATVYGLSEGKTSVSDFGGYFATFGININQKRVIGGLDRRFDINGEITFKLSIPEKSSGVHVYFQSAEQGTCPAECRLNLVEMVVE